MLAAFGRKLGPVRIGINQERVLPGLPTSHPHAHERDEEFVYVLEARPGVWIDGDLHALEPGDGVAFPAGTGIAHCFLNNTDAVVRC